MCLLLGGCTLLNRCNKWSSRFDLKDPKPKRFTSSQFASSHGPRTLSSPCCFCSVDLRTTFPRLFIDCYYLAELSRQLHRSSRHKTWWKWEFVSRSSLQSYSIVAESARRKNTSCWRLSTPSVALVNSKLTSEVGTCRRGRAFRGTQFN